MFFQDIEYISVDVVEFHIKLDDCFFAIIATCGIQAFHVLTATFLRISLFLMVLGDTLYYEARDFIDSPFLYLWIMAFSGKSFNGPCIGFPDLVP